MELRAFKQEDHALLISWIDSEKLNYQWGGPNFNFPLDDHQISKHCSKAEVYPFIFVWDGKNAGYVELVNVSDFQFRICRVFICDAFRGRGLSKLMLKQLIALSMAKYNAKVLSLAVFEHNKVALNCYVSLGFHVTSEEPGAIIFDGESWNLLRMEKRL